MGNLLGSPFQALAAHISCRQTDDFCPGRAGADGTAHIFCVSRYGHGDDREVRFIEAQRIIRRLAGLFRDDDVSHDVFPRPGLTEIGQADDAALVQFDLGIQGQERPLILPPTVAILRNWVPTIWRTASFMAP